VLNITTEPNEPNPGAESAAPKKSSLKRYVLEKLRTWVNSLLEAERDEFLGRGRHQPLDEDHNNPRWPLGLQGHRGGLGWPGRSLRAAPVQIGQSSWRENHRPESRMREIRLSGS
jgi:hypothetical protein